MSDQQTRILFFGTPEVAVPPLRALVAAGYTVQCVTNPDRPVGRAGALSNSAVKQAAIELGIDVLQPEKINTAFCTDMRAWKPVVGVVVAYGKILPATLVSLPTHGILNIHFSLLPRWRGASPVMAAVRAGDQTTGVTIMQLDAGLDTGPIVAQERFSIRNGDTTASVTGKLTEIGTALLIRILPDYLSGKIVPSPQPPSGATSSGRISKDDARLRWSFPADVLERCIRAYIPWPVAWTTLRGKRWKIWESRLCGTPFRQAPGTVVEVLGENPGIVCGDGRVLIIFRMQPEGKPPLDGKTFLHGYRHLLNERAE